MEMKATLHSTRRGGKANAKHNDRQFDTKIAEHIADKEKDRNSYYLYDRKNDLHVRAGTTTFADYELKRYEEVFGDYVAGKTERCIASRQSKSRFPTAEKLWEGKRTAPQETIYQIGSAQDGTAVPGTRLYEVYKAYIALLKQEGMLDGVVLLDVALHVDEGAPHIHERRVFAVENEYGETEPNQTECIGRMCGGRFKVDPKERTRNNNEMVNYTKACREIWYEACREYGYEIDEVVHEKRQHMERDEYKRYVAEKEAEVGWAKMEAEAFGRSAQEAQEELDRLRDDYKSLSDEISDVQADKAALEDEVKELRANITGMTVYLKKLEKAIEKQIPALEKAWAHSDKMWKSVLLGWNEMDEDKRKETILKELERGAKATDMLADVRQTIEAVKQAFPGLDEDELDFGDR